MPNQLAHFAIHADDLERARKFNSAPQPVLGFECSIAVDDVDVVARAVESNGGKIVMPKAAIPGVGWIVKFLDTEGNLACATQYDPAAR
jgi:predicted enzyme related to lactoylglutathione lyase